MFQFQKTSNYGTSTPAVARTLPQGDDLLGFFKASKEQKDACLQVLAELKRHLVRCVEISDRISKDIDEGIQKLDALGPNPKIHGNSINLPGVPDLHSNAEAFLQSAKLAIRECAQLLHPFHGVKYDHRFHKLAAWSEETFGLEDQLTKVVKAWEPWVKHIVTMRNAVDHPTDAVGGKLFTFDFRVAGTRDEPKFVVPVWGLTGGEEWDIRGDMQSIVEGGIELGEDVLVALFEKHKFMDGLFVYEIAKEQRDPNFPKRLRVGHRDPHAGA